MHVVIGAAVGGLLGAVLFGPIGAAIGGGGGALLAEKVGGSK